MKTSTELKRFFKDKLKITNIRVRTIPCKDKWMEVWIESERNSDNHLIYTQSIPLDFRQLCLRTIYSDVPTDASWIVSGSAGNVNSHSISMVPAEWDKVLSQYVVPTA